MKKNYKEQALEELKICIQNQSITKYRTIFEKAQNLVDALETEKGLPKVQEAALNKNKGAKLPPILYARYDK